MDSGRRTTRTTDVCMPKWATLEIPRRNAGKALGCPLKEQSHVQAAGSDQVPKEWVQQSR